MLISSVPGGLTGALYARHEGEMLLLDEICDCNTTMAKVMFTIIVHRWHCLPNSPRGLHLRV